MLQAASAVLPVPREALLSVNPLAGAEDRALRLLQRGAVLKDSQATLRVGDYHYYGKAGLAPSGTKAAECYKRATEQGKNPQVPLLRFAVCCLSLCPDIGIFRERLELVPSRFP